jgi:hypothetical protein
MLATAATRSKLAHAAADLLREFPDQPEQHVEEVIGGVAAELLEPARFDDFVPVLAHRRARENLRHADLPSPCRHRTLTVPAPGRVGVGG